MLILVSISDPFYRQTLLDLSFAYKTYSYKAFPTFFSRLSIFSQFLKLVDVNQVPRLQNANISYYCVYIDSSVSKS